MYIIIIIINTETFVDQFSMYHETSSVNCETGQFDCSTGFQISHCCWSFSSDSMAEEGLNYNHKDCPHRLLKLVHVELPPKRYWRESRSLEVGEEGDYSYT